MNEQKGVCTFLFLVVSGEWKTKEIKVKGYESLFWDLSAKFSPPLQKTLWCTTTKWRIQNQRVESENLG